ncbi:unnamed protein product [Prorocentrum cordatum]|uniref:Uncharacterized protein n=1 Tax=Prorocentrum cordatum TaxID=2364126 RepID=A0ABN9RPL1_9DINO|nr:unnamed protein product [Polarella glacialis]
MSPSSACSMSAGALEVCRRQEHLPRHRRGADVRPPRPRVVHAPRTAAVCAQPPRQEGALPGLGTWATPPPRTAARRPRLATRVRWRATSSRQLLRGNQSSSGEVGGLLCGVRCALLAEPPALPIVRSASDLPGARQQSGVGLPFGATALNGSARGLPERQVGSMPSERVVPTQRRPHLHETNPP